MIFGLKPYLKMKDSGIPWLGEVPEHWGIQRAKNIFRCIDVRSQTGEEELLTVSSERGVVPRRSALVTMFKAESYVGYKLCWPNDLVINSLWAWAKGLGVSQYHGIISTAYGVYRPNGTSNPKFINQLVRSIPFNWELRTRSKGVWTSRLQLTDDSFLSIPFPLPSLSEQAAIVKFIDHYDRRIRRYIRAKQKLIKLLEEQKQAIIHRAVTGQIDVRTGKPYPTYKPSGVEWLGEVPEHWESGPGKLCYREKKAPNTGLKETKVLSLSYGQIVFKSDDKLHGLVPASFETYQIIEGGDIIVRPTDLQNDRTSLRFGLSRHNGIITSAYLCLRTTKKMEYGYGYLLLHVYDLKKIFYGLGSGLRQNLDFKDFKYLPCLIPPLPEQLAIIEYLNRATTDIDTAITSARREIELLREYRTRLIADVVTGKLDVREAAVRLPDEIEEPEPLETADELVDSEDPAENEELAEALPEEVEA